ncbi:hypothetical protein E1200_10365 [Actinomadura sp. GC306]|uniref:protealysin inhibitor emfourin n=1 Tax=Actinomadura sp. GC306 TaxID=2530367 RepID=UPI0010462FFE|nr:protealysin inhibitor emfourin [Actinomadura sp. GC306]TDC68821.1 hypothetical protein E1200_10365 [Actinomadura sp. GC306]
MRVTVESTGGFTGRETVVARYDTAALPSGAAGRIRDAVRALDAAQARGGGGEVGADLPAYRITVSEDAGLRAETRVYEVRGDPATAGSPALRTLLTGPDTP